ncbi:MAG: hypothetical protein AAFV95_12635 [Bacteroidota bacterium]
MKIWIASSAKALTQTFFAQTQKNNRKSSLDFSANQLSKNQLSSIKGGDDSTDSDILIVDIIGG